MHYYYIIFPTGDKLMYIFVRPDIHERGKDCHYDKWNISLVICDTYTPQRVTKSWRRSYICRSDYFDLITKQERLF